VTTVRVIGPGRAGRSLMSALSGLGHYRILEALGRADDLVGAADDADVLVIATPESEIAGVAGAVMPREDTVVLHLSGAMSVDVLAPHARRGAVHPLVPLPNPEVGAERLRSGATFAVSGDPAARRMAEALGGRVLVISDANRAAYHAAATIAANHVVALLGQVERVAATAGLPLDAFAGLVRAAVDDAMALGPMSALTGPAARGDWETIVRHREVLASMCDAGSEVGAYDACVALAYMVAADSAAAADGNADRVEVGA
jgi:predicted short-subunit dehydrogenase-like oxidoreductase (DUF2520 family)